jgi:hypothetical protein
VICLLNEAEPTVALQLIEGMPEAIKRVLGDGVYDSMNLHRRVASVGKKLYAPIRQGRVGRRQQPRRLQLLRLWRRAIGRKLEKARDEVRPQTEAGCPPGARGGPAADRSGGR